MMSEACQQLSCKFCLGSFIFVEGKDDNEIGDYLTSSFPEVDSKLPGMQHCKHTHLRALGQAFLKVSKEFHFFQ